MSGANPVHWTQPNLEAKVENDGHGDTCGPIVIMDYLALTGDIPLNNAALDNMRQNLINWGLMNTPNYSGMTISSIATAFTHHYGVNPIKVVDYNASLNFGQFRQDLINALLAHELVIMETANAQALPDNQPGVQFHFVLFGGLDSNLGYYTCNGDTETGLRSGNQTTNPVWYDAGSLQASQPVGYIILPAIEVKQQMLVIEKDSNGNVTGAHDEANPSLHIGAGFAYAAEQQNLLNEDITLPETYTETGAASGNVGYCVLGNRYLGTWTPTSNVHLNDWAEAANLVQALHHAANSAPAPQDTDTAVNVDLSNVSADVATLKNTVDKLETDLASLQSAQTAD